VAIKEINSSQIASLTTSLERTPPVAKLDSQQLGGAVQLEAISY
jgi:hypothetical protein